MILIRSLHYFYGSPRLDNSADGAYGSVCHHLKE